MKKKFRNAAYSCDRQQEEHQLALWMHVGFPQTSCSSALAADRPYIVLGQLWFSICVLPNTQRKVRYEKHVGVESKARITLALTMFLCLSSFIS
jgi:hypothetical protein